MLFEPRPLKLLTQVRCALRTRHYSLRTEAAYVRWIRRYVRFHGTRHPAELGASEVTRFLSSLAVERGVSASTQNQALAALLFLYREVLGVRVGWLATLVRAKRPERLPVVLTRAELDAVLARLRGPVRVVAGLLYGAGLRLFGALALRDSGHSRPGPSPSAHGPPPSTRCPNHHHGHHRPSGVYVCSRNARFGASPLLAAASERWP